MSISLDLCFSSLLLSTDGGTRCASITGAWVALNLAFRTLQASGHIGKLVVRPPPPAVAPLRLPALQQAARGTVLVVGGFARAVVRPRAVRRKD